MNFNVRAETILSEVDIGVDIETPQGLGHLWQHYMTKYPGDVRLDNPADQWMVDRLIPEGYRFMLVRTVIVPNGVRIDR